MNHNLVEYNHGLIYSTMLMKWIVSAIYFINNAIFKSSFSSLNILLIKKFLLRNNNEIKIPQKKSILKLKVFRINIKHLSITFLRK